MGRDIGEGSLAWLRVAVALAVVVPVGFVAALAWLGHASATKEAQRVLADTARSAQEHAVRVMDRNEVVMQQMTVQNPQEILSLLADVALRGSGFVTECLLDYVLDEGFTEPIYLNASGEDPDAYFKGQSPAWAVYQVREWKRVLTISGGPGKQRRVQITETP